MHGLILEQAQQVCLMFFHGEITCKLHCLLTRQAGQQGLRH